MTERLRFNEDLLYWEYVLATEDELAIEEHLCRIMNAADQRGQERWTRERKHALTMIDRLKVEGRYDEERARLRALVPRRPFYLDPDLLDKRRNFDFGCGSHDRDQRARFLAFRKASDFDNRTSSEQAALLGILIETAAWFKKAPHRPRAIPPWRKVVSALDAIRLRLRGAVEPELVLKAAREVAAIEQAAGMKDIGRRARYLRKCYDQRLQLRQ